MKWNYYLLWLLLLPAVVHGQIITIDKNDTSAYSKKANWNGNITLGLEADKQKTTLYDASNFAELSLQKNKELFVAAGSERFTYNGGDDFLDKGFLHLRWRHLYKDQLHPEAFAQYQWDDGLGMVKRFVTGANLRYNFWHRQLWELTVATGVMYENEEWNYTAADSAKIPPSPVNQHSSEIKSNNYVKLEGNVSAVSSISVILYYQAAFNDFLRPRISGAVNFSSNISKHFALALQLNGLYDAGPVVPIFKFYYNYATNLVYRF